MKRHLPFLSLIFVIIISDAAFATKPGAYHIRPLEEKDLVVDLYLIGLDIGGNLEIKSAGFAGLPLCRLELCGSDAAAADIQPV